MLSLSEAILVPIPGLRLAVQPECGTERWEIPEARSWAGIQLLEQTCYSCACLGDDRGGGSRFFIVQAALEQAPLLDFPWRSLLPLHAQLSPMSSLGQGRDDAVYQEVPGMGCAIPISSLPHQYTAGWADGKLRNKVHKVVPASCC